MSTRAYILKKENNKFEGISLQHDGDLNSAGLTLLKHYTKAAKVEALIKAGECSELGETVKDSTFYEKKIENLRFNSISAVMQSISMVDYVYIFDNEKWFVLDNYNELEELERALELDLY